MAKSQQTFDKKEKEKKRLKKRKEKQEKREERKASNSKGASLDEMMMYLDEDGNLTETPPDPLKKKVEIDAESIVLGIPKKEDIEEEVDHKGKVSFFDTSKGFGFIIDSNSQEKYFVHVSGLIDEISENDKVTFELERGMKGMNAVKVKLI